MKIERTALEGVIKLTPNSFIDSRGSFTETYNYKILQSFGITLDFVQDNHSVSINTGTVRGLHYQTPPFAQDKLVRVTKGSIFDVAVDIRRGSPTYGAYASTILSAEEGSQFLVPAGFAHGFMTLEPDTHVIYKVTNYYAGACDRGLIFNDPDLNISWPLPVHDAILSEKDRILPRFADYEGDFVYEGKVSQ